jgi:hypothetical protein
MKTYIREMIDDLRREHTNDAAPAVPAVPEPPQTGEPAATLPEDLNNQELSENPEERLRQLDFQAQKDEERMRS